MACVQVVADNVTGGSFTESDLPCDLFYVYQVRAMVAGSAYGASKLVLGQAQSCTAGTSDGARAARSPSTPVRKLRLVTDRPTETSIRIRLLFHRNMDEGDLTHTPVYGMKEYRVDRTRPGPPITQTPVPADWVDPVANPEYRMEHTVSEFDWTGLACGTHYWFRALGHGDGVEFEDGWGNVWSNAVHGSSRGCNRLAAPVVDVIPLPLNSPFRKALLTWDRDDRATGGYIVQIRRKGDTWPDLDTSDPNTHHVRNTSEGKDPSKELSLDVLLKPNTGGRYVGLGFHDAYEIRVQAKRDGDSTLDSSFGHVTIVDSPITSVVGDSSMESDNRGKMVIKWPMVHSDARYTVSWYKLAGDHSQLSWRPSSTPVPRDDWESIATSTTRLDHTVYTSTPGPGGDVYAVQLNYTINGEKYFSARAAYGWVSDESPDGSGRRVATFPLNDPLPNGTYAYRICLDTFPPDMNDQADWQEMIVEALDQWESAVPDYVTMSLVTHEAGTPDEGKSKPCANNEPVVRAIKDRIDAEYAASLANQIDTGTIRKYVEGLSIHTRFVDADNELNEILLVELDETSSDVRVLAFNELSDLAGLDCFTGEDDDPDACAHQPDGVSTIDILINSSIVPTSPFTQSVEFNTCIAGTDSQIGLWVTLVHEAGHVLGIHRGTDGIGQERHHPKLSSSAVARGGRGPQRCSPTQLDIMAITALYQTSP